MERKKEASGPETQAMQTPWFYQTGNTGEAGSVSGHHAKERLLGDRSFKEFWNLSP